MLKRFWNDETGFVVSAELVLVATILVIGLVVGLAEVQSAVVQELNDVGEAVGRVNQSYFFSGFAGFKNVFGGGFGRGAGFGGGFGRGAGFGGGFKAFTPGSAFLDRADSCDFNECALGCAGASGEFGKGGAGVSGPFRGGVCDNRTCADSARRGPILE